MLYDTSSLIFLSTLSLRRATTLIVLSLQPIKFLSTLSLRRATHFSFYSQQWHLTFLSTLSLRRATKEHTRKAVFYFNFYPRSPCGERPSGFTSLSCRGDFYPRSPCGERRKIAQNNSKIREISIHALLAESDRLCTILYSCPGNFYPRSPCGERRVAETLVPRQYQFLSTLSLRRATHHNLNLPSKPIISIHALLAESDKLTMIFGKKGSDFYPRSPCGERHRHQKKTAHRAGDFYPRSPCGERQHTKPTKQAKTFISIHALLAESDQYAYKGV